MNTARTFASFGLAFALAGSSLGFAADSAAIKHGRDSVYASRRVTTSVKTQADYAGLQTFGREGGIPLAKKLATSPKRDVQAGRANVAQRFGRA